MEKRKKVSQTINGRVGSIYELAFKYYSIIAATTSIKIYKKEIQLLSFIAGNGNKLGASIRKGFAKEYNSSIATVNNMISKLKKSGLLIDKENLTIINPAIGPDFNNDISITVEIYLNRDE